MKLITVAILVAIAGISCGGYALYSNVAAPALDITVALPESVLPEAVSSPFSPAADDAPSAAPMASNMTVDGMQGDITALKEQLVRLRADISHLQRQVQDYGRLAAAQAGDAAVTDQRLDDPETREEAERQRQETLRVMETDFRQEPTDSRWVSTTTTAIQDALAGIDGLQGSARNIECRSQTCRVELAGDRETLARFVSDFVLQIGSLLPSITANQIDNGDDTTLILYLSGPSEELSGNES
ncbi:MAG: hypothetical protein V9G63_01680 [Candidatus Competibacter sp.]